jgi:hypothetical protein
VQDGRPGTGRAGDEDRRHDLLVVHAWVGLQVRHRLGAHFEKSQQEAPRDPPPEDREVRLIGERWQEHVERLEEPVVAEPVDTRPVDAERCPRLPQQVITSEGKCSLVGDRKHLAAVDRGDPLGTRRGLPGHLGLTVA